MIAELQYFFPHESFICLQNNSLVMLNVLNFIMDRRSSKTWMWTHVFKRLRTTSIHVLQGHRHSVGRFVQLRVIHNPNPQSKHETLTLISLKTFIRNFRHEKFDNKMFCVVCIMFGIANKNYVKRPDSNSNLGQQSLT